MKYSQYNIFLNDTERGVLLYNAHSDKVMNITENTKRLIEEFSDHIDTLKAKHPTLYEAMVLNQFVVNSGQDEYNSVIDSIHGNDDNPHSIHITINPTLDCNFRCWYCYESHIQDSVMSALTIKSVKKLISSELHKVNIKKIVLSFFGGEPLMYYNEVMKPIMAFAKTESEKTEKILDIYMTSNAYLLSADVVHDLMQYKFVSIQVPFDGNRTLHNKTKHLKNGEDSFDVVMNNSLYAIGKGLEVVVRCNYTNDNIDSFADNIEYFKNFAENSKLNFAFHKIWQEKKCDELQDKFERVLMLFKKHKLIAEGNGGTKGVCYADHKQNMVVNYNGDIYKCTARDFKESNRLGVLKDSGEIEWFDSYYKRLICKYKSAECRKCVVFPICMQGCSQDIFESTNENTCTYNYSKDSLIKMAKKRVDTIL